MRRELQRKALRRREKSRRAKNNAEQWKKQCAEQWKQSEIRSPEFAPGYIMAGGKNETPEAARHRA
jgi:hypothetical protein